MARPAEALNGELSRSLEWTIGGRTQVGWRLYVPLIQQLISTRSEPDSVDFAKALAGWQKARGLNPHKGVLDEETWSHMVATWQNARTHDATTPPADELVLVAAEQWLYPERPEELRYLRRDAYAAYLRLLAAARAELGNELHPDDLKLISGFRTPEYQEQLRQQAGGNPSTASLARRIPHFSGRALDIYVGGEPVSTADSNRALQVATPCYRWLVANGARFGFRPYFFEPWHWEYDPRLDPQK